MIHWNVDPVLFTLGPLSPRWYGVLFALAFWLSYKVMFRVFTAEGKPQKDLDVLTMFIIAGTLIGARMGHVFFYEPHLATDPMQLIAIWQGGLASHGGALGIITGLWLFHRTRRAYSMTWLLDRLAIVSVLSGVCIRLGNLFNSEIIGRPTDMPWSVWFMRVDALPIGRHPTQVYEALLCLAVFFLLWQLYKRGTAQSNPGRLIGLFMVLIFAGRFMIEFVKEHQEAFEATLPIDMGQILSLPFIAVGVVFLVRSSKSSSRLA